MAKAEAVNPVHVQQVNFVPEGIVITFQDQKSAFFEAQFLYDYQDVNGNYPFGDDTFGS